MADPGGFRLALNVNYYYGGEKIYILLSTCKGSWWNKTLKKITWNDQGLDKKLKKFIPDIILSSSQINTLNAFIPEILES